MNPADAFALLQQLAEPWTKDGGFRLERDDFGDAILVARRDLPHLDADALSDRLHAWTRREAERKVPGSDAFVSFRHARPATHDEASLDLQERWLGLEPTLRLDLHRPVVSEADVRAWAGQLVPAFVRLLDAAGRPEGWRSVDEGNAE